MRWLLVGLGLTGLMGVITVAADTEGPGSAYTYTFDGAPASPQSMYAMDGFDVQVHRRDAYNGGDAMSSLQGQHGPNCEAPPASHLVNHALESVYQCANHVMTAINEGYGVIYLTPDRMLDWSDGEATLSIDVSTLRMSGRDWWDLWLIEWDEDMALPLSDRTGAAGTDLQGPPDGDWLHIEMMFETNSFRYETNESGMHGGGPAYSASSAMDRDTFVLTITGSTFSFCKPDESICWAQGAHQLNVTQAVVKIGHHTYDPTKAISSNQPGTWHWDNLSLSDSVPFTIIRANERSGQTFTFEPAPANAFLRFSGIGELTVNGQAVSAQNPYWNWGHFNSYRVPIAEGTTSVTIGGTHPWGLNVVVKDVSIVSLSLTASPTPTSSPSSTPTATATDTPTSTPTPLAPTPPNTPTPTATNTATSTPSPSPDVCHEALYRNGVLEMGAERPCP